MRGDAAGRGRPAAARERLLVLLARLAQLHAHVDQAGRQAEAAAVDDLGIRRARPSAIRCGPKSAMRSPSVSSPPGSSRPLAGSSSRALT